MEGIELSQYSQPFAELNLQKLQVIWAEQIL